MNSFYIEHPRFFVSVDCLVFGFAKGELKLLLSKRKMEPAQGTWSLPGGFIEANESAEQAAARVLNNLTGLENIYMEQLKLFSKPGRDPGERVLSVAFYALLDLEQEALMIKPSYQAYWFDISKLPELIFDHPEMVDLALKTLRHTASTKPISFNLLPEKFTLPQMQSLFEAIYERPLDKRNFRKKIQSMPFLVKLNEKDKLNSRKGAFLYTFDKKIYEKARQEGFCFNIL